MATQWIHVVPRATERAPQFCQRCEDRITERWTAGNPLCAKCGLEEELFDREGRE